MLHTSTGARTSDLLKSVGLESHLLYHIGDFHDMNQFKIEDVDALRQRIRELRESSINFLNRALKNN